MAGTGLRVNPLVVDGIDSRNTLLEKPTFSASSTMSEPVRYANGGKMAGWVYCEAHSCHRWGMKYATQPADSRNVLRGFVRLADELREYRQFVLPHLVDAGSLSYHSLDAATEALFANACGVGTASDRGATHCETCAAIASARATLETAARAHLLSGRTTSGGWFHEAGPLQWHLGAMLVPWPSDTHDHWSKWLDGAFGTRTATRLVRAIQRLPADEALNAAEALVRLDPSVPDAVLLAATPNPDARSWLLGAAMELRANNHFGRVRHTAVRSECRGNWRCFQAPQVLDILFQKWLILHDH